MGVGYPDTPGIWSSDQIEGWKLVTEAVHEQNGHIVLQLWHVGRISDPIYLNGLLPVAPSAIAAKGHVSLLRPQKAYVTPRALEYDEILGIIEEYRIGAQNAVKAGFDGVEIHGANGYLLDQFLHGDVNHRTDSYGGSIENRARLLLQVLDVTIGVWGKGRVGLHLSPCDDMHDISDADPLATYEYIASEANHRAIAFICAREPRSRPGSLPLSKSALVAFTLRTNCSPRSLGKRYWALVKRMRSRTASSLLPIRTYHAAFWKAVPSTCLTLRRSTPKDRMAIPTIPRWTLNMRAWNSPLNRPRESIIPKLY